mmetsp:Transcript_40234/g.91838  ORF Transcript_40234/g.91838 Transcript_40234/m.91838 type:complete len:231 (+) Transcript_40234:247-939(+)
MTCGEVVVLTYGEVRPHGSVELWRGCHLHAIEVLREPEARLSWIPKPLHLFHDPSLDRGHEGCTRHLSHLRQRVQQPQYVPHLQVAARLGGALLHRIHERRESLHPQRRDRFQQREDLQSREEVCCLACRVLKRLHEDPVGAHAHRRECAHHSRDRCWGDHVEGHHRLALQRFPQLLRERKLNPRERKQKLRDVRRAPPLHRLQHPRLQRAHQRRTHRDAQPRDSRDERG